MDPVMHIVLPTLLLLALRLEPKRVLIFAPFAIVPDLDAIWLHRAFLHNIFATLAIPMAFIVYSKLRRPEWFVSALLIQFFLFSHVALDLGGVSIFWPFVEDMWYFNPDITLTVRGGFNISFELDYGWKEYTSMGTTSILSDYGFAVLFLGILVLIVFRKETVETLKVYFRMVKETLLGLLK